MKLVEEIDDSGEPGKALLCFRCKKEKAKHFHKVAIATLESCCGKCCKKIDIEICPHCYTIKSTNDPCAVCRLYDNLSIAAKKNDDRLETRCECSHPMVAHRVEMSGHYGKCWKCPCELFKKVEQ